MWRFTGRTLDPKPATHALCEPAQSKRTWTFHKSHFVWNWKEKWRTPSPRHTFRASLRNRNAHRHFTRATLCGNLQQKCRIPIPGQAFCANLCSRNAHGHFRRAILYGKFTGKMPHAPATTSIKHCALTLTVRTPSVWPHCLGNCGDKSHGLIGCCKIIQSIPVKWPNIWRWGVHVQSQSAENYSSFLNSCFLGKVWMDSLVQLNLLL